MKTVENWYEILDQGLKRQCGGCEIFFRCTGHCPPERWLNKQANPMGRARELPHACYCLRCLKKSGLDKEYIEARLRNCDPNKE